MRDAETMMHPFSEEGATNKGPGRRRRIMTDARKLQNRTAQQLYRQRQRDRVRESNGRKLPEDQRQLRHLQPRTSPPEPSEAIVVEHTTVPAVEQQIHGESNPIFFPNGMPSNLPPSLGLGYPQHDVTRSHEIEKDKMPRFSHDSELDMLISCSSADSTSFFDSIALAGPIDGLTATSLLDISTTNQVPSNICNPSFDLDPTAVFHMGCCYIPQNRSPVEESDLPSPLVPIEQSEIHSQNTRDSFRVSENSPNWQIMLLNSPFIRRTPGAEDIISTTSKFMNTYDRLFPESLGSRPISNPYLNFIHCSLTATLLAYIYNARCIGLEIQDLFCHKSPFYRHDATMSEDPQALLATALLAVVSVAVQLADGCIKLYMFWDSIKGAPEEVAGVMDDLLLLSTVLEDISSHKRLAPSVTVGLRCCLTKVRELNCIVEEFDLSFRSTSRRERLWSAFKATTKSKQLKRFRESLSETKSTLMLALMYQSIQHPQLCITEEEIPIVQVDPPTYIESEQHVKPGASYDTSRIVEFPGLQDKHEPAAIMSFEKKSSSSDTSSLISNRVVKTFLKHSLKLAVDNLFESGTVEDLMNNTLNRMTTFESTATGEYTSDDYNFCDPSLPQGNRQHTGSLGFEGKSTSFEGSRSRVCHQTSSIGVVVGNIWVRTSTLRMGTTSTDSGGNFQIVTSFIFYPASWLSRIGLGQGVEASLRNSKNGWQFDFNPIRAVSDSSLIFELCKIGDVRPVEHLIQRGDASIRDTSSKGWTPLHFAAANGHVDLCASLINMGADKRALVYEGPTKDTLSPITIFAVTAHEMPAEQKIRMLRLFSDCLELSDPSGDGWTVHAELKKAYNKENVPVSRNSISWLLRTTASERLVAFGPKTVWHALQHAVRSFLVHERDNRFLQRLLDPDQKDVKNTNFSQAAAMGHWLAIRASQRKLLPMVTDAGRFLHLGGFDWVEDDITPSHFVKALPVIYTTWSLALPDNIDKVEAFVSIELEDILVKMNWTESFMLESMRHREEGERKSPENVKCCSSCGDDYSRLGVGLVAPAWIAFVECIKTGHKFHCSCTEFLVKTGATIRPVLSDDRSDGESDVDEEFFRETEDDILESCEEHMRKWAETIGVDPFLDAATLLYRAQGRVWLHCYEPADLVCATCFLFHEEYIGEDGLGTEGDFSPMPESFVMFRSENYSSTVEKDG
ncbi:hypothetical protein LSUE1_G001778 [Lachnellula suecica]|uniref:Ankyrin repeat protein n=1 Tax=Lachnellula suecica TaxID=602035 RepID=A0A8T9CF34_9HELO|nr:hypothetical protein LSUE1_G001778 [Lachnellula suecica]